MIPASSLMDVNTYKIVGTTNDECTATASASQLHQSETTSSLSHNSHIFSKLNESSSHDAIVHCPQGSLDQHMYSEQSCGSPGSAHSLEIDDITDTPCTSGYGLSLLSTVTEERGNYAIEISQLFLPPRKHPNFPAVQVLTCLLSATSILCIFRI